MQKRFCVPLQLLLTLFSVMISVFASGQTQQAPTQASVAPGVPRLVKFSGVLKDASGTC